MRPYFEDLSCRLRLSPGFPASFPEHLHTQLELVCLFSGRARMLVDGRTLFLEPGDVCLCFPGATHGYAGAEAAEGLMLIAAPEQFPDFAELLERRRPASPVVRMDELPPDTALCLDQLRRECARETSEPAVRGYAQVLLSRMLPRMELVDPPSVHSDTAYRIMRYLSRHFAEPLTLTELAKALSVSPSHLSHTFSQRLHTSFRAYVNALRADHACTLLRSTDFSVTRIAYECGFETQRTFNRAFLEQCGETPSEYRRRARPELNDRFQR